MNTIIFPASDLDLRIADAFRDGAKSSDVSTLIEEAQAAAVASDDTAEQCRTRALDPALAANDVAAARREMDDAAFRRDRLQTAVQRLEDRLSELLAQEEQQRRQAAYDRVKAERDALAEELARVYPSLEAQLGALLARLEANDREVQFVNTRLPNGSDRLHVAELVARGLDWFSKGLHSIPSITSEVCLPAFKYARERPYTWNRR